MSTDTPNRYPDACQTCGVYVAAAAGFFMPGRGVQCPRHAAMTPADAAADYAAAEQAKYNEHRQRSAVYAVIRHAVGLAANPAEADRMTAEGRARAAEHARVMAERYAVAEANGGTVCTRCGGVGGSESWPGWTCYDCDGRGWVAA